MGELVEAMEFERRRLEQFRKTLADQCRSRPAFLRNFEVDQSHIVRRAAAQDNWLRTAIDSERISSVIIHGRINFDNCRTMEPLEVVFEGMFERLEYVDVMRQEIHVVENVYVRVVVRKQAPRHLIVTVYPDRTGEDIDNAQTPKVPYEVW